MSVSPSLRRKSASSGVRFNQRYSRISQFFRKAFDGDHYRNMVRALNSSFDRKAKDLKAQADYLPPLRDLPNELTRSWRWSCPRIRRHSAGGPSLAA